MMVSHSKILTWKRCHKLYDYKYNQKLQKKLKNGNLYLGSLVHEALESFFKGKNPELIFEVYEKKFDKLFDEEKAELGGLIALGLDMFTRYVNFYDHEEYTVIEVEKQILVPLTDDIELEGKIDLIVSDKRGRILINEHKTCKSIPDEAVRMADVQTVIYWWALKQMGIEARGVIWDYLRKKIPTVPTLLKSGKGLSVAQNIDTTPKVYLQAIKDNGLDEKDYEEILSSLSTKEETFLKRIKLPFNKALMNQVVNDTKSAAIQIKVLGEIVNDRNMTKDCTWCDFFSLCQTEMRGLDSEFIRKKQYTARTKRN